VILKFAVGAQYENSANYEPQSILSLIMST